MRLDTRDTDSSGGEAPDYPPRRPERDASLRVLVALLQEELHAFLDRRLGAVAQAAHGSAVLVAASVARCVDRLAEGEVETLGLWERGPGEASGQGPQHLGAATEALERRPHRREESRVRVGDDVVRLLASDGPERDHRAAGLDGQAREAHPLLPDQLVALALALGHLPAAAREDEHRFALTEQLTRVLARSVDGSVAA